MDFDVKLAHSNMDRDTAFKYPWITAKNCEERLKILELSIQVFADTVVDAGSSKIACTPPFTKLAVMFEAIVIEYLKLRHRRITMQLDGAVKDKGVGRDTRRLNKEEVLSYVSSILQGVHYQLASSIPRKEHPSRRNLSQGSLGW